MMSIMPDDKEWALSQAARILGEPQHRLIYLCEKQVIVPDFAQARGRGSGRRFSTRNLLEFALALKIRELMIPVNVIRAIIYVLREFESRVRQEVPGFNLPQTLRQTNAPDLRVIVVDGPLLYFSLGGMGDAPKVFGGVPLENLNLSKTRMSAMVKKNLKIVEPGRNEASSRQRSNFDVLGAQATNGQARLEVNITRIAMSLPLTD
jgi:hypothetical protein